MPESESSVKMDFETINMADVPTKSVDFLWESFIPFGTVSYLSGEGGLGKSFFTLAIAAAVTRGLPLPGQGKAHPPADVIIQNAENPLSTVVKPRLEAGKRTLGVVAGLKKCWQGRLWRS